MTAIDSLRIELEVLKSYMERYHPGFADSYPKFKEEAIQAIDPEWIGSESAERLKRLLIQLGTTKRIFTTETRSTPSKGITTAGIVWRRDLLRKIG